MGGGQLMVANLDHKISIDKEKLRLNRETTSVRDVTKSICNKTKTEKMIEP